MLQQVAVALALLAAFALAGCADDAEGDGSSTTTSGVLITYTGTRSSTTTSAASTTTSASTATTGAGEPANQAPAATFAVAVDGTNATFTLEGSDPDGDVIVWDLAFGDGTSANGTSLPATVVHAYAAGNFTAGFTVTDGKAPTSKSLPVIIQANVPAAFYDTTKPWTVSFGGVVEFAGGCFADGTDCAHFELPPGASGRAYTIEITATVPAAVYFLDYYSGGEFVETIQGEPAATGFAGEVPGGVDELRVYATGGADFAAHVVIV
jgi:hypothetical protein